MPAPFLSTRTLAQHPPQLCKLVLPGMRERGRGVIINIGSGAATVIPTSPLLTGGWEVGRV